MCLFANTKRLKVAKEDIKCYKRITFFFNGADIKFVTPYQWTIVPNDVLLGKEQFSALGRLEITIAAKGEYTIFGGVIHAYAFERDACESQCSDELVVACIIPKGTRYIEGHDGWGRRTIAAKTIKVDAGFKDENELKEAAIKVENWFKKMYGR